MPRSLDREESLLCPLTLEHFKDPVRDSLGFTYERAAIEAWLEDHDTSPSSGEKLPNKSLTPDGEMAAAVTAFKLQNQSKLQSQKNVSLQSQRSQMLPSTNGGIRTAQKRQDQLVVCPCCADRVPRDSLVNSLCGSCDDGPGSFTTKAIEERRVQNVTSRGQSSGRGSDAEWQMTGAKKSNSGSKSTLTQHLPLAGIPPGPQLERESINYCKVCLQLLYYSIYLLNLLLE